MALPKGSSGWLWDTTRFMKDGQIRDVAKPFLKEAFFEDVQVDPETGCWVYLYGRQVRDGYRRIQWNRKHVAVHRLTYEIWYGPIPGDRIVLHSCDNPPCCNPGHLRAGTHADNSADRVARGRPGKPPRKHCPQGHPYDEANTYVWWNKRIGRDVRMCRACHKKNSAESVRKRRGTRGPIGRPKLTN